MAKPISILGICGSLRRQSYNLGALKRRSSSCPRA